MCLAISATFNMTTYLSDRGNKRFFVLGDVRQCNLNKLKDDYQRRGGVRLF